ncbi:MAG: gliding motility-associated C-terminal domain-containing protein [Cytophagaceae bacterium]|nr:gliding motility-associated C-terminal domain-containing protein [Cytophagaceae bacterium]MDW8456246.1 gliding motility-associated C-terminal domain-containing protein [Cytophagaceae bacterium]
MKNFVLLVILLPSFSFSQIDREFWFAPPEVSATHADHPIYLRVSTTYSAANFKIYLPANTSFVPLEYTLSAYSTLSVDLTRYIHQLETRPENSICNTGLYILSDHEITAYYEVLGSSPYGIGVNSDIFTLKGNNALGMEFYIPFQNYWNNHSTQNAYASFDIVATEHNTSITIYPTKDLVGHPAGIPFTVVLNRGQTYSARAASVLASERPSGTRVVANKPIAITIKDDSMIELSNYDLAGDQLIPVEKLGTQYIAPRFSLSGVYDRLFICATQNNTDIFINGSPVPATTLQAGQIFQVAMALPVYFIESTFPVYIQHVGGYGPELAGAILPPLGCTGSRQVSFTRSVAENFSLYILVKTGGESSFTVNGNSSVITSSAFSDVAGTGGLWKYALLTISESVIPVNSNTIVQNDITDFHLAIANGSPGPTGFRYGYFSDYGFMELGPPKGVCIGDSMRLDAGFGKSNYLWNTGSTQQYIYVHVPGMYKVTATKGTCIFTDSIEVFQHPDITTPILRDTAKACANEILTLSTIVPYAEYLWYDGSRRPTIVPQYSGNYWIEVTNDVGCKKKDTVTVIIYPLPYPHIRYERDTEKFCKDSLITLDAGPGFAVYEWNTGHRTQSITIPHADIDFYTVTVTGEGGCKNTDTVYVDCSVVIGLVPNLITSNGDGKNDIFYVQYLKNGTWTLEVVNRWGQRVYYNNRYDNSWQPQGLSEDVYYFSFRHNGGLREVKGWLQIINKPAEE